MKKYHKIICIIFILSISSASLFASKSSNIDESLKIEKAKLENFIAGTETYSIAESLKIITSYVSIATDKANQFLNWDPDKIRENSTQLFDETINALDEYITLFENDGPINQAVLKIQTTAIVESRSNREKANYYNKLGLNSIESRYNELSKTNKGQIVTVKSKWQSIKEARVEVYSSLEELEYYKELCIDIAVTEGISAALAEMEVMADRLNELSKGITAFKNNLVETNEETIGI